MTNAVLAATAVQCTRASHSILVGFQHDTRALYHA